jgi:hypothetical protein
MINPAIAALAFTLLASQLSAQTPPAPSIGAFSEESVVDPADIDAVTAAAIPSDVLASIQAGSQEIHQIANLNAAQNTLTINAFLEPAGSPVPTPAANIPASSLWSYAVQVSNISVNSKNSSVTMVGTVNQAGSSAALGSAGATLVFSAAYATSTAPNAASPNTFSGIAANLVGAASIFAKAGLGTVQMSTLPAAAPVAVAGPKGQQTTGPTFQLDGTQSSDPNGSPLSYQWTFLPTDGQVIQITNSQTATPTVAWDPSNPFAYGDYTFRLMVTNTAGLSSTDTVTVTYVVTPPSND